MSSHEHVECVRRDVLLTMDEAKGLMSGHLASPLAYLTGGAATKSEDTASPPLPSRPNKRYYSFFSDSFFPHQARKESSKLLTQALDAERFHAFGAEPATRIGKAFQILFNPGEDVHFDRPVDHTRTGPTAVNEGQLCHILRPIDQTAACEAIVTNVSRKRVNGLVLRSDANGRVDEQIGLGTGPLAVDQLTLEGKVLPDGAAGLGCLSFQKRRNGDDILFWKNQADMLCHLTNLWSHLHGKG